MDFDFDLIVIGGGSAGYNGANDAVGIGLKTAVIDGAAELGGLCILRGCMPSKALIESANRNLTIQRAAEFGLNVAPAEVDGVAIQERKQRYISEFAAYRREQLMGGKFSLIRGAASFVDPHTISVLGMDGSTQTFRARGFLIATGSVIQPVTVPGLTQIGYLDSDLVLELRSIPESVIVLGGGAIALEMAHYLSGVGARVTVIQRSEQVLRAEDFDVAEAVTEALRARGVTIYTGTQLIRAEWNERNKAVVFLHEGLEKEVSAREVVFALGRTPNSAGLHADRAGVTLDRDRIETNNRMQTSTLHIFAAGDVAGKYEVVHMAIQQAGVAVRNLARMVGRLPGELEEVDYRLRLFVVFTHPEVARVGATEKELAAAGVPFRAASYPFLDHGKSLVMGETDGFVKLLADPTSGEILGGAVVGPGAAELIHEIAAVMHFRGSVRDLLQIPHYHPTLSEIWTYPAEELAEALPSEPDRS